MVDKSDRKEEKRDSEEEHADNGQLPPTPFLAMPISALASAVSGRDSKSPLHHHKEEESSSSQDESIETPLLGDDQLSEGLPIRASDLDVGLVH